MRKSSPNALPAQEQGPIFTGTVEAEPNWYFQLSPRRRIKAALEMADEIIEFDDRTYCVLAAAVDALECDPDVNTTGQQLAKVAEELLRDIGQKQRLRQCLQAMEALHG